MRVVLVGGGTGGHFYPLMAVAEELRAQNPQIRLYYMGPDTYNEDALIKHNIQFVKCPAGKIRRYFSPMNLLDPFKTVAGIFYCFYKLFMIMPDVVFSKGGYTSIPVLIMARYYRIPVVIHESDTRPGRANKFAMKFARYIGISYDDVAEYFPAEKTALTGIPIRSEILNPPADPFAFLSIPNDVPLIYITGGSLGAERINTLVLDVIKELLPYYRIFHQTGTDNEQEVRLAARTLLEGNPLLERYYIVGNMPVEQVAAVEAAASLTISRAGSTSIHEIAIHGKPSILIPIPEAISHDQRTNAYAYARTGAALVLEEKNLTRHLLIEEINTIMSDAHKYQEMSLAATGFAPRDAAKKLAGVILQIGNEHGS